MISIQLNISITAQVTIKCMGLKWSKKRTWSRLSNPWKYSFIKGQQHTIKTLDMCRTYVSDCWMDFIPSEKSCFSSWNGVMPIFLFSSEAYLTFEPRTCLRVVISPSTYKISQFIDFLSRTYFHFQCLFFNYSYNH